MARKKNPSIDASSARSERLRAQSKDELVALLDELAGKHPEVEARLARHALAADPLRSPRSFASGCRRGRSPQSDAGNVGP